MKLTAVLQSSHDCVHLHSQGLSRWATRQADKAKMKKKLKTFWGKNDGKMRKMELLPTQGCEAGYTPDYVWCRVKYVRSTPFKLSKVIKRKSISWLSYISYVLILIIPPVFNSFILALIHYVTHALFNENYIFTNYSLDQLLA